MENVNVILDKLQIRSASTSKRLTEQEYEQRRADDYNASAGTLTGYDCEICKNKGFIAHVVKNTCANFENYECVVVPCKCQRIRAAFKRLERSGLKNAVKTLSFDTYQTMESWQRTLKETVMRFCKDEESNWLFIGGQSGAGKSHLCTAVAINYIRQGYECHYMQWLNDAPRLKACVNDSMEYEKLIKPLKESPVLYIDDMFKNGKDRQDNNEPPTPADVRIAFEILNYRYNRQDLITIISSERTLAELINIDEAIAGRIAEKSKNQGYCLNLKRDRAKNYRLRDLSEI